MNDNLREVCLRLARHRKSRLLRILAAGCRGFVQCCENYNYNPKTNGEHQLIRMLASQSMACVFDVGANVGQWAMAVHEMSPTATIHAFELVPATVEQLRRNTVGLSAIVTNDCGLADRQGPVMVRFFHDDSELSSLVSVPYDRPSIEVPSRTVTGDAYCAQNGIGRIDFLKIDTEGSELLVLKGLSGMLAKESIDVIQFEYSRINVLSKFLLKDFYNLLGESRYAIGKLFPDHVAFKSYELVDETFMGPNYVAVRRGRPDLIALLS